LVALILRTRDTTAAALETQRQALRDITKMDLSAAADAAETEKKSRRVVMVG
jgi:hypothetical protein